MPKAVFSRSPINSNDVMGGFLLNNNEVCKRLGVKEEECVELMAKINVAYDAIPSSLN